jgi:Methyltransferase domain
MEPVEPALFYTGLVADIYAPLRSAGASDPAPYIRFVRRSGEPALELGCGDGDPLLDLRARGIDVEGLDSSPDMLARCRANAAARGLVVTLHQSPMESMELRRHYRSIYLAGPTFNLITDDDTAWRALARIRAHLEPGGSALIPLFVPPPMLPRVIGVPRTHVTDDGVTLRFTVTGVERADVERVQVTHTRYERERDGAVEVLERDWLLHWYTQDGFRQLISDAGLLVDELLAEDGTPAPPDATSYAFVVSRDPAFDRTASVRDRLPPAGRALAAGMLGLDEAIYGEKPKVEIVAEADADGLDLGDVDLDMDDPAASSMTVDPDHGSVDSPPP